MKITISDTTYQQLIKHLKINSETDASTKVLLEKLEKEAKPLPELSRSAFLIDGSSKKPQYKV